MLEMLGFDRKFVRAEGVRVFDDTGREYLDFLGAYGALNVGHNNSEIADDIRKVIGYPNFLQTSISPFYSALAHNLSCITPGELSRVFLCNSGTESVEGALKLARIVTGKKRIVYTTGGFHGKTMGALSVTGRNKYREPFEPLVPDCVEVPFGDAEVTGAILNQGNISAFIVEPVQGEGRIRVPPEGYLKKIREMCTKKEFS